MLLCQIDAPPPPPPHRLAVCSLSDLTLCFVFLYTKQNITKAGNNNNNNNNKASFFCLGSGEEVSGGMVYEDPVCVGVCRCASVFCVNDSIFSVCAQAGGGRPSQYSPCLERRLLIPLLPGKCGYKYLQHMEALMTRHTQAHTETPKQTWMHGRICRCAGERASTRSRGYMFTDQEKTGLRDATSASIMNQEAHDITLFIGTALVSKVGDVWYIYVPSQDTK